MADYTSRKWAGISLPLPSGVMGAGGGVSSLRIADPAIYFMLDYFAFVLNKVIGPSLIEYGALAQQTFTSAVQMKLPLDPKPILDQDYASFPLLAVYRIRGTTDDVTLALRHGTYRIAVDYLLPPLTASQAEILTPFLTSVAAALEEWTEQGFDPDYTPPEGAAGDRPMGETLAQIEGLYFKEVSWGLYPQVSKDLPFYGVMMQAELTERSETPQGTAYADFEGADVQLDATDAVNNSSIASVAQIATQESPTFTSVAPTSAPVGGGTALVITGTLYRNPVRVWIAGVLTPAAVTSATRIDIASSPIVDVWLAGGTTFDIEIDCAGQTVLAEDAFTFTP
jgi:hypothetical protein